VCFLTPQGRRSSALFEDADANTPKNKSSEETAEDEADAYGNNNDDVDDDDDDDLSADDRRRFSNILTIFLLFMNDITL